MCEWHGSLVYQTCCLDSSVSAAEVNNAHNIHFLGNVISGKKALGPLKT